MPHEKYRECIDICLRCAVTCEHCAASCLNEEHVQDLIRCIKLDQACADICFQAARLMSSGSELAERYCAMCADICEMCGRECEKHDSMEHCRECAEICFECARICRDMAGIAA